MGKSEDLLFAMLAQGPSLATFRGLALKKPAFFGNKSWSDPVRIV
jgi:hypothetical protein